MAKIVIMNKETDNQLQEQMKIQGTSCPEPYVFFPCSFCPYVIYWQIYVGVQSLYFHDPCVRRQQFSAKRGASCVTICCLPTAQMQTNTGTTN